MLQYFPQELLINIGKLLLSMFLGLFVGYEREAWKKPAGIRDVGIVTLGATIFTIISFEMSKTIFAMQPPVRYDIGRIIAYVIASIGFLGSGVILQQKDKLEGITTASILWAMVGVGILCGMGSYSLAIISCLGLYFLLKLKYLKVKIQIRGKHGKKKSSRSKN